MRHVCAVGLWAIVLVAGGVDRAPAQVETAADTTLRVRASVTPGTARLGEPVRYRGVVVLPPATTIARWLPPEKDADLTWGTLEPRRVSIRGREAARDTLIVEATLQAFRTGTMMIPGLRFETGGSGPAVTRRLPGVALVIAPVLTAADSNADLRPVRGPAAAPWWEQVPWRWVLLALAGLAVLGAIIVWLRRRRRRVAPDALPATDPAAAALAELAALRGLRLPAHGRFAEHAFHLTRIVRRYLETVVRTPRPGHTSAELMTALERSRLTEDHRRMLSALLRVWDRVKFARAPSSVEESVRAEEVVEQLIRQLAAPVAVPAEPERGRAA